MRETGGICGKKHLSEGTFDENDRKRTGYSQTRPTRSIPPLAIQRLFSEPRGWGT